MKRTSMERFRLGVVLALVCLFFGAVGVRLVHLQIVKNVPYSKMVDDQTTGTVEIPATRGLIYDRCGQVVAFNVFRPSLYAYATDEAEIKASNDYLDSLNGWRSGTAAGKCGIKKQRFRWIDRRIDQNLAEQIVATAPRGLYVRDETQREYPHDLTGRQVLGFTNIDNRGQAGVEYSYDSVLAGRSGRADIRRDGVRNLYRVKEKALVKPELGRSLVLTIDWRLQELLEEQLQQGVDKFNARSAMGVFMDCRTGEILAMAHFDPEEEDPDRPMRLRPVCDQFEPGSVLKAVTVAGLMEAGLVSWTDSIYCEMGKWRIKGRVLHDDKELGWLLFPDVFALSSNIGIAKCAIEMGGDRLYRTMKDFGFGQRLDIGLGGEISGQVFSPEKWSDYTIAALAMGHSIAANCVQIATAFSAIANGGELLRPKLVLCSVNERGGITEPCEPEVIRRVIKPETADSLSSLLRSVVERGTATKVNSPAVAIAGKTGTAEMIREDGRGYHKNKYVASFAGFFPAEEPRIVGVVVMHQPEPIHYGGHTAGPIFRTVAENYMVINPDLFSSACQTMPAVKSQQRTVEVPELEGHTVAEALARLDRVGLRARCNSDTGMVSRQFPRADRLLFPGDEVILLADKANDSTMIMPDLRGLSIRQASAYLAHMGIKSRIQGQGRVRRQSIPPGANTRLQDEVRLECRPG